MKHFYILILSLLCLHPLTMDAKDRFVLVIDAGHGGHDSGALGKYSKEKDLTLKFALAFGKMVEQNCKDVKVVYTRTTDRFLPLIERAEVANKNKADLFVSVHINSIGAGRIARGFQTYTLGTGRNTGRSGLIKNLEVAKRENSVILLEKDYRQTYQGFNPNSAESNIMFEFIQDNNMVRSVELARLMQRHVPAATGRNDMGAHQDNLAVLRLSSMPGCLLELGFISTPDEEDFMNSSSAADLYARGIYNAFIQYKNKYYGSNQATLPVSPKPTENAPKPAEKTPKPAEKAESKPTASATNKPATPAPSVSNKTPSAANTASTATDKPVFKVQIFAQAQPVGANDSRLKGLTDVANYTENGLIKYTVGATSDYTAAQQLRQTLLNQFPQAFIVAFINGTKTDLQQAIQAWRKAK